MKAETLKRAETFVKNRQTMDKVFRLGNYLENLAGTAVFLSKDEPVEEQKIRDCRKILQAHTSVFSMFRDYVEPAAVATLAVADDPEDMMDRGMNAYKTMKTKFGSSSYLPVAALTMAAHAEACQFEELTQKARAIFDRMRKNHPFLTSSEDCAFCTLMAIMNCPEDAIIEETEKCFKLLKEAFKDQLFMDGNALQALALVLALCEGTAEDKCDRTMQLFRLMKDKKHKYGTSYELATLGAVAMSTEDYDSLSDEIIEVYEWLGEQKGFGFWSMLPSRQKLMYAALITMQEYRGEGNDHEEVGAAAAVSGIISLVIAQEVAMYVAISTSMIHANSSSTSH